jgi:hypothetical protein
LIAARGTSENGRHVLEQLQPAVEETARHHLESHVGPPVEDPLLPGATRDDRKDDHPESVDQTGLEQRPAQREAAECSQTGGAAPFSDRTASTGSSRTSRVLAHSRGSVRLEEKTTLGAAVSSERPSSPEAAKPDISR